jgi:hypothetical protein
MHGRAQEQQAVAANRPNAEIDEMVGEEVDVDR